eukprot:TRINITY_DN12008_c0_g1_i3.p1 TRINITY_DN12008_c0_g1~~TRINITY_DN12008_c0_g1_i3.p1  ORF type:complete len:128 (+),score=14.56 TRINITY_DN12008_c0_g1_i3:181-564(+)
MIDETRKCKSPQSIKGFCYFFFAHARKMLRGGWIASRLTLAMPVSNQDEKGNEGKELGAWTFRGGGYLLLSTQSIYMCLCDLGAWTFGGGGYLLLEMKAKNCGSSHNHLGKWIVLVFVKLRDFLCIL